MRIHTTRCIIIAGLLAGSALVLGRPAEAKRKPVPCLANANNRCEVYAVSPVSSTDTAELKIYQQNNVLLKTVRPYGDFKGNLIVQRGDMDGDGAIEFVTVPNRGLKKTVKVWSATGELEYQFQALEDSRFTGDVDLALVDLNGDGDKEVAIAVQTGGGPKLSVYNFNATTKNFDMQISLWAYEKTFRGGLHLGAGDIDGDQKEDIIIAPFSGSNPVKVYGYTGTSLEYKATFYPFSQNYVGGVRLKVGNVMGDGQAEIVATPARDANPEVKVYGWNGETMAVLTSFQAYGDDYLAPMKVVSGLTLALGDILGDAHLEIITAPRAATGAPLRVWQTGSSGIFYVMAYHNVVASVARGLNVLARDIAPDRDTSYGGNHDEIIVAPRGGMGPILYGLRYNPNESTKLEVFSQHFPFSKNFRGEVRFDGDN